MKFIKIPAFAIVLLLLMQIVSKAFIAIDSSDIEKYIWLLLRTKEQS